MERAKAKLSQADLAKTDLFGGRAYEECSLLNSGSQTSLPANLSPLKITPVFDTYWKFAAERQRIFFSRVRRLPAPWTTDSVLNMHKFTNVYRATDRVSQYLINNVIYNGSYSIADTFFRIILFKIFNRIDTWELLEREFGEILFNQYSYANYDRVLTRAMESGKPIYSAAYIMPSGGRNSPHAKKHQMHLRLIEKMICDELPQRLADCRRMSEAFSLIIDYPTIGDFLAYQYITDLNYGPTLNFSEMEFVCAGPGAKSGIRKCFSDTGRLSDSDIIRLMVDRQEEEFDRLGLKFDYLGGRRLQLIDCQNIFCEVDKYSRVAHPEYNGALGRVRIKQKFRPVNGHLSYGFPPKWKVGPI